MHLKNSESTGGKDDLKKNKLSKKSLGIFFLVSRNHQDKFTCNVWFVSYITVNGALISSSENGLRVRSH